MHQHNTDLRTCVLVRGAHFALRQRSCEQIVHCSNECRSVLSSQFGVATDSADISLQPCKISIQPDLYRLGWTGLCFKRRAM